MSDLGKFFSIKDLGHMPPPSWAVDGLFENNSLVMVAGPPGSMKSFLVLDWLLCMACGRNWQGRKTTPARVLYVLGEGRSSLLKRIKAWEVYNRPSAEEKQMLEKNFKVTFDVPQMAVKASVDNLLVGLSREGYTPTMIAIDTFARSFVGMDENSQRDVGMWVDSADRLRGLGFTVIFLHHTSKNTEMGVRYRGSTAILGAMDTAMTMVRDGEIPGGLSLTVTKQKDHDEGKPLYFLKRIIQLPEMKDSSVVLTPTMKMDERFTEKGQEMLKRVEELVKDRSFRTDTDRAIRLAQEMDISEGAAKMKISRFRTRVETVGGGSSVVIFG